MAVWRGGNWKQVYDGVNVPWSREATLSYPLINNGTKYQFRVRALNAIGASPQSLVANYMDAEGNPGCGVVDVVSSTAGMDAVFDLTFFNPVGDIPTRVLHESSPAGGVRSTLVPVQDGVGQPVREPCVPDSIFCF